MYNNSMCNWQLLVFTTVITLLADPVVSVPVVADENNVKFLHRKLEEALTKNSTLLFQLQKLFIFNPTPKTCYDAEVIIEVRTLNSVAQSVFRKCTYSNYECEYGNWTAGSDYYGICPGGHGEFQTSLLLLGYQTTSLLRAFDPLFYYMITTFSNVNRKIVISNRCHTFQYIQVPDITLKLFIDTLDILPSYYELSEAEMIFLSLVSKMIK